MSRWTNYQDREAREEASAKRQARYDAECCPACGVEFKHHPGTISLCDMYHDLMDAVVNSHLGEVMAHGKLRDIAEAEIKRRSGL